MIDLHWVRNKTDHNFIEKPNQTKQFKVGLVQFFLIGFKPNNEGYFGP